VSFGGLVPLQNIQIPGSPKNTIETGRTPNDHEVSACTKLYKSNTKTQQAKLLGFMPVWIAASETVYRSLTTHSCDAFQADVFHFDAFQSARRSSGVLSFDTHSPLESSALLVGECPENGWSFFHAVQ